MQKSYKRNKAYSIHLHGKTFTTRQLSVKDCRLVKEMAGLEILIQKGTMQQWAFNRLKELAEKLK